MAEDGSIAGRLRRPTWRDPRLLVGILLICVAVVGVALALRAADRTTPYYVASHALVPGDVLEEGDLRVVDARLDGGAYLAVDAAAPWGGVVTRVVDEGELVPVGAIGEVDAVDGRVVGVVAHAPLAPDLKTGSTVDLWVGGADEPATGARLVAEGLVVQGLADDAGAFSVGGGRTVYLTVPSAHVAAVLDAVGSGGEIAVVGRGLAMAAAGVIIAVAGRDEAAIAAAVDAHPRLAVARRCADLAEATGAAAAGVGMVVLVSDQPRLTRATVASLVATGALVVGLPTGLEAGEQLRRPGDADRA